MRIAHGFRKGNEHLASQALCGIFRSDHDNGQRKEISMLEKLGRNLPCWCGSGKKYKSCHLAFDQKVRMIRDEGHEVPGHKLIKNEEQIQKIRESARINVACLDAVSERIREGMPLSEINDIVNEVTYSMGGIPAPLDYQGYPYSVCTSVNSQVCHGFPLKERVLQNGDIVNVDCSTILDGYFSDSSRMFMIGEVSEERRKLVQVTKECMERGLDEVRPWAFLGDMGQAVNDYARANGYSVVRNIGGHGCGVEFHEDPFVSYVSRKGTEMLMVPGMIFTIEPMVNMGSADVFTDENNGWEVYTRDGKDSAQWEIQVLVTENGHEVISW